MKLNAYTLFDNKALQYHPPFFASTDAAAVRSINDLVQDPKTMVGRHPGDYVLYRCGSYDDSNAFFTVESPLGHIVDAVSLVKIAPDLFSPLHKETV